MEHQHQHQHQHQHHGEADSTAMIELLDLDAEVLHSYLLDVTTWVGQLATDAPTRVLDLGAGTGTGTLALARQFGGADVIAVDRSAEMLARVRARAEDGGLADRVRTVHADLDVAWPAVGLVDLVWAASALHELTDPVRVFKDVFAAVHPGGLVAVVEMGAPPRFLPDDIGLGRPGLEARCHDAVARAQADWEPHPDWGLRLEQAGFTSLAGQTFTIDLTPPHPISTGRYARAYLRRIRPVLEGRLAVEDLSTLDTLLTGDGPDSLLHRDDLVVRGTRTAWAARRP
jgi:SAM-dependent methyltransferase